MSKNKHKLIRTIVGLVIFASATVAFNLTPLKSFIFHKWELGDYRLYVYLAPYLAAYVTVGYDVIFKAVRNLFSGRLFDENFLMTVATVGAIALCDFPEAVAVMLFYQVGELFQSYAVGKSRKSISELMDICPETACVIRDGEEQTVSPDEVAVGEILVVRAGDRIPVDCTVVSGSGSVDASSLTGESVPRSFAESDELLSGCINLSSAVRVRADKEFYDSTASRILDLVENASAKKARTESFITRFARYYTPCVVFTALALAVIPPLFNGQWAVWIKRALSFLVVSCPCALVISVPLSFFGGIGGASRRGILVKGGGGIESLSKARTFVFDKTGTLTHGAFEVTAVFPEDRREEILTLAAIAETGSRHPIAQSILRAAPSVCSEGYRISEIAGKGVEASGFGDLILVGTRGLLEERGVTVPDVENKKSAVYLAKNGSFIGVICIEDTVKDAASETISTLKKSGCYTVMLTGDNPDVAREVAIAVGVDEWRAGMLPQDKVAAVEEIKSTRSREGGLCFVGDGINDAPVLAMADVGVSMGGIGSDAAIEASDVVLMNDDISSVVRARRIASKTMRIVRQNVVFALGVKLAVLVLSAFGLANMWIAVFADVGVAVIAILNAMRTLVIGNKA